VNNVERQEVFVLALSSRLELGKNRGGGTNSPQINVCCRTRPLQAHLQCETALQDDRSVELLKDAG
jgi:hypothetical protein